MDFGEIRMQHKNSWLTWKWLVCILEAIKIDIWIECVCVCASVHIWIGSTAAIKFDLQR